MAAERAAQGHRCAAARILINCAGGPRKAWPERFARTGWRAHTRPDFDPVLRRRAFKLDSGYLQALVKGVVDAPRQTIGPQHQGLDAQSCCGTVKVRCETRRSRCLGADPAQLVMRPSERPLARMSCCSADLTAAHQLAMQSLLDAN